MSDSYSEIHPSESGLNTSNRCYQITLSPEVCISTQETGIALMTIEYMLNSVFVIFWGNEFLSLFIPCRTMNLTIQ